MTDKIFTRDITNWKPKTFNDETRSVRVVAVTESLVHIWDWERNDFINEVLLVDGACLPPSRQIPLLDCHNRSSVSNVLGSAKNFQPVGKALECDVFFSGTDAGKDAAQKVKEGHLTDFSVGYMPVESYWIPQGEAHNVNGRTFEGPVKVTARWNLKELSITPIGADQKATVRVWNNDSASSLSAESEQTEKLLQTEEEITLPQQEEPPHEENTRAAPDMPVPSSPPVQGIRIMDIIFYSFIAVMVLFFIKGLLG